MKKLISTLFVATILLSGAAYAEADKQSPLSEPQAIQLLQAGKPVYSCQMHQHIFSDKNGKCPVCGMNLTQVSAIEEGKAAFSSGNQSMPMMNIMEKK